jgi:beta-lactamase regulating signal transducer with metallopeptidase domain/thiol-disulfide isomerase/thioredoxin
MSRFSTTWSAFSAGLPDASIGLVLIAKWSAVLALAWLAHGMLAGRNPRWRVALWRSAIVGLALVSVLSLVPPIVTYRPVTQDQPIMEIAQTVPTTPTVEVREAPAIVREREPTVPTRPVVTVGSSAVEVRRVEPASTEVHGFRWADRLVPGLCGVWLAGVLVLTSRLIAGSLGLARVIRRSEDVPEGIVGQCSTTADRLGCHRSVRVRRTSDVATPCLAGLWRPVLLLPDRECEDIQPTDLRAILAHELAHARNHDLAWNLAAHVSSILLWFHPLAWRIRAAHGAACDAVCDAVAADLLGDVASYSRTLARLAVRAAWPSPAHGLAMARTSDVRRRLDALNRKVFRTTLSWRLIMPAFFVGSVLLVLIGGFGFTRAEQAAPAPRAESAKADSTPKASDAAKPEDRTMAGKLTLRAVAAETNEPIEGVSIAYVRRNRSDGKNQTKGTVTTGKDGMATIEYPPSFKTGFIAITARKPKLVPIYLLWDDERHPLDLPTAKELRFEPGTTIGGVVKDEAGHPIEGATVHVHAPPTEYEGTNHVFSLGETETDAQGRWRLDVAPRELGGVFMNVEHPHFRRNGGHASRDLDSAIVLTKGLTVTGRVVDAAGRPVRGARAIIGHDTFGPGHPTGTTNERGEFTLENCDLGPTIITVQAEGFAPRIQDVRVEDRTAPVEFQLTEPGSVVRGKVVDIQGKPVAGAIVAADTWREDRSIDFRVETDNDGRFEWKNAPKDAVLYDVFKADYMRSRLVPLTASHREQIITLYPELVITGRVTDAETGGPVPGFRLVRGQKYPRWDRMSWAENEAVEITGGRYTIRFDMPCEAFFVRVEVPGYQPAESRAFRSTEGSQTFDFALRRGGGLSGVVLLPDGKPAAGAEVVLATEELGFLMEAGRFDRRSNFATVRTGPDGRFTLHPKVDKYLLVAASDAGYADASQDEFARSGKLLLKPWGKIEGVVWVGDRPGADQEIVYYGDISLRGGRHYGLDYGYRTRTDARGRFAFDRVAPGRGRAARVLNHNTAWGWQEPVVVESGRTTRVRVGGRGRAVIGRLVLDGEPETPIDWTRNPPVVIHVPPGQPQFISNLDKDGRFRVEDVPPGKYRFRVGSPDLPARGVETRVGWSERDLDVPEAPAGQPGQPLDLGAIEAHLTVGVGDAASDFDVERIDGKGKGDRLRLGDERGKVVLIDFWATWCVPCVAELPALVDIHKTFGGDPRFRLISLSCDETAEPVLQVIREKGLTWTHGLVSRFGSGIMARYDVRAIPSTFLVGPDGRVLAKDLRGAELKEAVRKALEDPKLFPAAIRTTPPPSSR